eukprot:10398923-Alexandrium_andersonii.AAC.1
MARPWAWKLGAVPRGRACSGCPFRARSGCGRSAGHVSGRPCGLRNEPAKPCPCGSGSRPGSP